ncbi:unnamed protein product [Closterium sp. Naga37s-1]|nr:unnamed protein product [Closterium sp. Naga37s-1]
MGPVLQPQPCSSWHWSVSSLAPRTVFSGRGGNVTSGTCAGANVKRTGGSDMQQPRAEVNVASAGEDVGRTWGTHPRGISPSPSAPLIAGHFATTATAPHVAGHFAAAVTAPTRRGQAFRRRHHRSHSSRGLFSRSPLLPLTAGHFAATATALTRPWGTSPPLPLLSLVAGLFAAASLVHSANSTPPGLMVVGVVAVVVADVEVGVVAVVVVDVVARLADALLPARVALEEDVDLLRAHAQD